MTVTAVRPTSAAPLARRRGARRLVLGLAPALASLAVVLLGSAVPAAAAPAASTPPPSTTTASTATASTATASTTNTGAALGWSQDTVYVQSDATSRWPVRTAAERLGKGSPLRLVLVATCPVRTVAAQPAVQCIRVSSGDLGGDTLAGTTGWTWARTTNKLSTVTTTLNDRWAAHASYADRLNIAEHELGHGVGLAHVRRTSSVMNAVAHGRTRPDAGDLTLLNRLY